MKKIGLVGIMLTALATFGVQAQGSDITAETWRCFDPYDLDKNTVLVELTREKRVRSATKEEQVENMVENLKSFLAAEGVTPERPIDDPDGRAVIEDVVESMNAIFDGKAPGQVSVAGVTHPAVFYIEGLNRRWDFGKQMSYSLIIKPNGSGSYYDFSRVGEGEPTGPSQRFDCVLP